MMLRLFRPDLLCGLGGFALGAAPLLLTHGAAASPPPPPPSTSILAQAQANPATRPADPRVG
jgi:hypothetical protein